MALLFAGKRYALVIGNTYSDPTSLDSKLKWLPTCNKDATAVADILEKCDFNVTLGIDKCLSEMNQLFDDFLVKLDTDSVAVFYFSGHGCEYKGWQFYFPCQWEAGSPEHIISTGFNCHNARNKLNNKVSIGLKIILSDCCREELSETKKNLGKIFGADYDAWNEKYDPKIHMPDVTKGQDGSDSTAVRALKNVYHMCACASGQLAAAPGHPDAMSHFTEALVASLKDSKLVHDIYTLKEAIVGTLREKDQTVTAQDWDFLGKDFKFEIKH